MLRSWLYPLAALLRPSSVYREVRLNPICIEWMWEQLESGPWGDESSGLMWTSLDVSSCPPAQPVHVLKAPVCLNLINDQLTIFCYEIVLNKASRG